MFNKVIKLFVLLIISSIIIFSACQKTEKEKDGSQILAEWDGGKITEDNFNERLDLIPEFFRPKGGWTYETKKKYLENYAVEEIFYNEAKKQGIDQLQEVKDTYKNYAYNTIIDLYKKNEIADRIKFSESEIKDFYNDNKDKYFTKTPTANILYIQTNNLDNAEKALQEINSGKKFSEVAKKYSENKHSLKKDGKLENVRKNQYIPTVGKSEKLNDYIFTAKINEISEPIEFQNSYHIISVTKRDTTKYKDFNSVKKEAENRLQTEKKDEKEDEIMQRLINKYNVTIDTLLVNKIIVPQIDSISIDKTQPLINSSVNDIIYTFDDFRDELQNMPARKKESLQETSKLNDFLKDKMNNNTIYYDAITKGYESNPEIKQKLERSKMVSALRQYYKNFVVDSVEITDEEILQSYQELKDKRYRQRAQAKIQQFKFDDKSIAEKAYAKAINADSATELNKIVKEYCTDTKNNGIFSKIFEEGYIPGLGKDENYNKKIFSTDEGEFSEIFVDKMGNYVFFKVLSRSPQTYTPVEQVKPQIKKMLDKKKQKQLFEELKDKMASEYNLKLYNDRLEKKLPADTLFKLAQMAKSENEFHSALYYYDKIIKYYPNGVDDYKSTFMKGFIYSEHLNDSTQAVEMFEKVLDFPEYPDVPREKCELHESARYMLNELQGKENILDKIKSNEETENK